MRRTSLIFSILMFFLSSVTHATEAPIMLIGFQGEKTPFSSLKGQWVFINYWASWCGPCVDEIAELNRFYQDQKGHVALYAVNFEAVSPAKQVRLMNKFRIKYPGLAKDPGPELGLEYPRGVPVTFVFDPSGKLVDTLYGGQTKASLASVIRPHQRA